MLTEGQIALSLSSTGVPEPAEMLLLTAAAGTLAWQQSPRRARGLQTLAKGPGMVLLGPFR